MQHQIQEVRLHSPDSNWRSAGCRIIEGALPLGFEDVFFTVLTGGFRDGAGWCG
jgi:hypothetical protein